MSPLTIRGLDVGGAVKGAAGTVGDGAKGAGETVGTGAQGAEQTATSGAASVATTAAAVGTQAAGNAKDAAGALGALAGFSPRTYAMTWLKAHPWAWIFVFLLVLLILYTVGHLIFDTCLGCFNCVRCCGRCCDNTCTCLPCHYTHNQKMHKMANHEADDEEGLKSHPDDQKGYTGCDSTYFARGCGRIPMENMNDWRWYGESGGVVDQCFNRPRGSSRRTRKKEAMKEKQEVIQDLEDAEPVLEKKARSSRSKSSSRRRPPPGQEDEEMEEKTLR